MTVNGPKEAGMVSGKVSDKSTVSGKVSNAGRGGLAVEVGDADGDAAEALTSRVSEGGGWGVGVAWDVHGCDGECGWVCGVGIAQWTCIDR